MMADREWFDFYVVFYREPLRSIIRKRSILTSNWFQIEDGG